MSKSHIIGALSAVVFSFISMLSHASLTGILPATAGGTDWQAFYDDQLDISWTANANINGLDTWGNQDAWVAGLDINGVTGWRLPNMDVNGDNTAVKCSSDQAACKDNEYGHLYFYGAGTVFGSGITASSPGPFSNVLSNAWYWASNRSGVGAKDLFIFTSGTNGGDTAGSWAAWAVHDGNVSTVPVPAAVWLFGSGLLGLIGVARRKKTA
jgi:hypothetical protein